MKMKYMAPEPRSIKLRTESLFCQSASDKGLGIDPVTPLDSNDDEWSSVF